MAQTLPNELNCPANSLQFSYGNGTGFASVTIEPANGPFKPSFMTVNFYDQLGDKIYSFKKENKRVVPKLATPVVHKRVSTPDKVTMIVLSAFLCCTVCYTARYRLRDPDAPSLLVKLVQRGRGAGGKDAGRDGAAGGAAAGSYSSFADSAPVELDLMKDPEKDPSVAAAFRMFGIPVDKGKKTAKLAPEEMTTTNRIRERMREKSGDSGSKTPPPS